MAAHVPNRISTLDLQPQNCCLLPIVHATLQQWRLFTVTVWQLNEIHFASMCSRKSTMITDHWVHADLQCRSTWSTICLFFFFTTLRNQCTRSTRNKEKKWHGLTSVIKSRFLFLLSLLRLSCLLVHKFRAHQSSVDVKHGNVSPKVPLVSVWVFFQFTLFCRLPLVGLEQSGGARLAAVANMLNFYLPVLNDKALSPLTTHVQAETTRWLTELFR